VLGILDVQPGGDDVFVGRSTRVSLQRVFGGQTAGQALVAAHRTVMPERRAHSLHSYFLRPGDPDEAVRFDVERVRDGRTFSVRRVVAHQEDDPIFALTASFQVPAPEQGAGYATTMPVAPDPETLPSYADRLGAEAHGASSWALQLPIELRYVDTPPDVEVRPGREPRQLVWMRAAGPVPDDPALHVAMATYASDLTILDSVLLGLGIPWCSGRVAAASLDHAMWFHRPVRADEWLLYVQDSPSAGDGRGFSRGEIYRRDGALAVSVAQESMARVLD
jgi:acyl-CoA thioesterase-2